MKPLKYKLDNGVLRKFPTPFKYWKLIVPIVYLDIELTLETLDDVIDNGINEKFI